MKKLLSVLLMVTCILGLTACAPEKAAVEYEKQEVLQICDMLYGMTNGSVYTAEDVEMLRNLDDYEKSQMEISWRNNFGLKLNYDDAVNTIESWMNSAEEIGTVSGINQEKSEVTSDSEQIIAKAFVEGSEHNAVFEVVLDPRLAVESMTVSVNYSFGEAMGKAGLNTLMGMGTVFTVLILISLIISCFSFIPKIQAAFSKKSEKEEASTKSVNNTIAQIIEKEELSDDLELVAVISAAIAASEGAVTTDGFVVRSIKRANRRN